MTSPHHIIPDDWPLDPGPDQWTPDDWNRDCGIVGAEPVVDVPAGLIGTAIELLDLCDELFNRPGSKALDARVAAVIGRYQRPDVATLRWFHDGLGSTAAHLHELLDDQGIVVEPEIHGPPRPALPPIARNQTPACRAYRGHSGRGPATRKLTSQDDRRHGPPASQLSTSRTAASGARLDAT